MSPLTKPKLVFYLVAIFLAGGISGGFIGYHYRMDHRPSFSRPTQEQMVGFLQDKLVSDVGITPEQWVEIGPIITNSVREIGELDSKNRQRIGELIAQSDAAIIKKLSPEQVPRMQAMIQDRQKHKHGSKSKSPK